MCIRDRVGGLLRDLRQEVVLAVDLVLGMDVEVGQRAGGAAVSYTHLRAHETVLDLVCRLLLEKKIYSEALNPSHLVTPSHHSPDVTASH